MKARVYITLKPEVLDPQGDAVRHALGALGFSETGAVRVGKLIELELPNSSEATATNTVRSMCERLLANPVIEDYRFDLEPD